MDDEQTIPEREPWEEVWVAQRSQELQESVLAINARLIRHEPQQWEIAKAKSDMYNMLCQEYDALWDDFCDLKEALTAIAKLNPAWEYSALAAVDKAKKALEGMECE